MRRPLSSWLLLLLPLLAGCEEGKPPAPAIEIIKTKVGIEMARIPAGTFEMGSTDGESDETPVRTVRIAAFLMDRTEVTQEAYRRLEMPDPSHFKGLDRPVEHVTWNDAANFCNDRSADEGLEPCYGNDLTCNFEANGYRLPTEAEWEYACRGGSAAAYSFGRDAHSLGDHAWFVGNASKATRPVAQKRPNAWGLYDLHGNVAEWCNDAYAKDAYAKGGADNPRGPAASDERVLRGGSWNSSAAVCRSAFRAPGNPGFTDACFARDETGFRCVRRIPKPLANLGGTREAGRPPTGFVFDELYLKHDTGPGFPERADRLTAIAERLKERGLTAKLAPLEPSVDAAKWIATIHDAAYIARVKQSCATGASHVGSRDAPVSKRSYDAAVAAASGVLTAIDAVVAGKARNAFCAVRPPGHHALRDRAMGFCLFNNVAIAARYIQRKHKLAKVLIVDWDVHHGNGTQAAFYDDPTVLFFSIHQSPFYPGTGAADETGKGTGLGFTLNVPVPAGSGDEAFVRAFEQKLRPASNRFKPDFVLISAGFDAHEDDPIGGCRVTASGFARLTRIVKAIADAHCKGRLVSVLEGGYSLEGLADSAEAHVRVLMD